MSLLGQKYLNKLRVYVEMVSMKNIEKIYEPLKEKLKGSEGKIIAIEPETGDYFIGKDIVEAYEKGRTKYPHKEFFFKRVGTKTAFVVGTTYS